MNLLGLVWFGLGSFLFGLVSEILNPINLVCFQFITKLNQNYTRKTG